jgi:hypothetical protein
VLVETKLSEEMMGKVHAGLGWVQTCMHREVHISHNTWTRKEAAMLNIYILRYGDRPGNVAEQALVAHTCNPSYHRG